MIPELRERFNREFTPEKYADFLANLDAGCGTHVTFRNCETPCFFPRALLEKMARYGRELIEQLMQPAYRKLSDATIPPAFHVPNEDAHPLFLQADFGIAANNEPKLVEIQGFPSLYAYQPYLADTYRNAYGVDASLTAFLGGLNHASYAKLLREAIVGAHDPVNVVLLEIEPEQQKTLPDFLLTEKLLGVRAVDITQLVKDGKNLFYRRDGKLIPIERIYNRTIVDEVLRKNVQPAFDFRDELDVEWAGHPNWYFRISKFSLPYLDHSSVPKTHFLDKMESIPADLENYVLKPLYSFAGLGVIVGPTAADVAAVIDRSQYILQERVKFEPVIATPEGPTQAEVRIMYIWLDEPKAVTTIIRMGRGKMMGVDHNRDMSWIGASAGFIPA